MILVYLCIIQNQQCRSRSITLPYPVLYFGVNNIYILVSVTLSLPHTYKHIDKISLFAQTNFSRSHYVYIVWCLANIKSHTRASIRPTTTTFDKKKLLLQFVNRKNSQVLFYVVPLKCYIHFKHSSKYALCV